MCCKPVWHILADGERSTAECAHVLAVLQQQIESPRGQDVGLDIAKVQRVNIRHAAGAAGDDIAIDDAVG